MLSNAKVTQPSATSTNNGTTTTVTAIALWQTTNQIAVRVDTGAVLIVAASVIYRSVLATVFYSRTLVSVTSTQTRRAKQKLMNVMRAG